VKKQAADALSCLAKCAEKSFGVATTMAGSTLEKETVLFQGAAAKHLQQPVKAGEDFGFVLPRNLFVTAAHGL
jgi:hypothetical protein